VALPTDIPCPTDPSMLQGSAAFAETVPDTSATAAELVGSGTLSPGIPAMGTSYNNWTFSGTAVGKFNGVVGQCAASMGGNSGPDTLLSGSGTGTSSCLGSGINVSCSFTFARNVNVIDVSGTCAGTSSGTLIGRLAFAQTTAPTAYSYSVIGSLAIT